MTYIHGGIDDTRTVLSSMIRYKCGEAWISCVKDSSPDAPDRKVMPVYARAKCKCCELMTAKEQENMFIMSIRFVWGGAISRTASGFTTLFDDIHRDRDRSSGSMS